jgi:hypothetical protein
MGSMDHDRVKKIAAAVRKAIEMCEPKDLPWPAFPGGACGDTTLLLGQVLDDAGISGFEYICGNRYKEDGTCASHAWLQNGEWIVDITADQFPEVEQTVIVTNSSGWHKQWHPERPQEGTLKPYGDQVPQLWRLLSIIRPQLQF